jgi:hypothetical protein
MKLEGTPRQTLFGLFEYDTDTPFGHFVNRISKVHDFGNGWGYKQGLFDAGSRFYNTAYDTYSMLMMAPSALYTGFSFYGSAYYFPGVR